MSIEDWTKSPEGNITVTPLIQYETMIFAGMGIAVRLRFANPGDELENPSGNVQLAMTPIQAAELGRALLSAADRVDFSIPPGTAKS